jgi:hypothetical protein
VMTTHRRSSWEIAAEALERQGGELHDADAEGELDEGAEGLAPRTWREGSSPNASSPLPGYDQGDEGADTSELRELGLSSAPGTALPDVGQPGPAIAAAERAVQTAIERVTSLAVASAAAKQDLARARERLRAVKAAQAAESRASRQPEQQARTSSGTRTPTPTGTTGTRGTTPSRGSTGTTRTKGTTPSRGPAPPGGRKPSSPPWHRT